MYEDQMDCFKKLREETKIFKYQTDVVKYNYIWSMNLPENLYIDKKPMDSNSKFWFVKYVERLFKCEITWTHTQEVALKLLN